MKNFILLVAMLAAPGLAHGQETKSNAPQDIKNSSVYPENPENIVNKNATAKINMMFDIDKTGHTANCQIISSTNPEFDESALDHCRHLKYAPATVHGRPAFEHHHHTTLIYSLNQ